MHGLQQFVGSGHLKNKLGISTKKIDIEYVVDVEQNNKNTHSKRCRIFSWMKNNEFKVRITFGHPQTHRATGIYGKFD